MTTTNSNATGTGGFRGQRDESSHHRALSSGLNSKGNVATSRYGSITPADDVGLILISATSVSLHQHTRSGESR
jgi:hypothetical protein